MSASLENINLLSPDEVNYDLYDETKVTELDEVEHFLTRSDTFIGSTERVLQEVYLYENEHIIKKSIITSQGEINCIKEPIDNMKDNVWRSRAKGIDPGCLSVSLSKEGYLTMYNEGDHIPIVQNEVGDYMPTRMFSVFRVSSNYDDTKDRIGIGGRNGFGVKITNFSSLYFKVECYDPKRKLLFTQEWSDHSRETSGPLVTNINSNMNKKKRKEIDDNDTKNTYSKGYVSITFKLADTCGHDGYNDDLIGVILRMIIDMSATTHLPVEWQGPNDSEPQLLDYTTMTKYASLYLNINKYNRLEYTDKVCDLLLLDTPDEGTIISFSNCIFTPKGGTHTKPWMDLFCKIIKDKAIKDFNASPKIVTNGLISQHLTLFLSFVDPNVKFDSQTKGEATKGKPILPKNTKQFEPILEWNVFEVLKYAIEARVKREAAKTDGKKTRHLNIKGLFDANLAGSKRSSETVLMITEGLSAVTFAVIGRGLIENGTDYIGAYALRGKILNVDKKAAKEEKNVVVHEIKVVTGLRADVNYDTPEGLDTLRYGKVVLATDADPDGTHIRGLVMSFFNKTEYRPLLKGGYVCAMLNFVAMATKKGYKAKKKDQITGMISKVQFMLEGEEELSSTVSPLNNTNIILFYDKQSLDIWTEKETNEGTLKNWNIEWFKGLGRYQGETLKYCFKYPRIVRYEYDENAEYSLRLAFSKGYEDPRKEWMGAYNFRDIIPYKPMQSITEFVEKELIQYAICSLDRAMINIFDGLTTARRKVLFTCLKFGLIHKNIKVQQLGGKVAETTTYHQGEDALSEVIFKMGQRFPGSNNIALLRPVGNFGNRLQNGKNHAGPRYPETHMESIVNFIYPPEQDCLLEKIPGGDGEEPMYYYGIIPMCLANGANSLSTGYRSVIPNYNPLDLVRVIKQWLSDGIIPELIPWYRYYQGEIFKNNKGIIVDKGCFEQKGGRVIISEIPVGVSYEKYTAKLYEMRTKKQFKSMKEPEYILDDKYMGKDAYSVEIVGFKEEPTHKRLGLETTIPMSMLYIFNEKSAPQYFETVEALLEYYCLLMYNDFFPRLAAKQISILSGKIQDITLKLLFLGEVVNGTLIVSQRDDAELEAEMLERGYPLEYLSMQLRSLTMKKIAILEEEKAKLEETLAYYRDTSIEQMWNDKLDAFLVAYNKYLKASE